MSHNIEEMEKHIRIYLLVFLALAVLTAVTVWASYLHVAPAWHLTIALTIATVKGTLVAAFFMHLINEKKLITWLFLTTMILFVFLLVMVYFADVTRGPRLPYAF